MKKTIVIIVGLLAISCSNKPTLQKYFVEHSESSDFIAVDLAPSIINTEKISLTESEKEALNSFEKLNILAFQKDSLSDVKYKAESDKVKTILKNEDYEQLMRFGNTKNGGSIYVVGNEDVIDEFVLFASGEEQGFVIARILGDNMNPNNILNLLEVLRKADLDLEQLKPLQKALTNK
jgi:hypothetical protein